MSTSDKPHDIRRTAKRSVPTAPPVLRRAADKRTARRIGTGPRETARPGMESAGDGPTAHRMTARAMRGQVIKLSWADTFGRPTRADLGRAVHAPASAAQVLPFRNRAGREDSQPGTPRGGDQPPVPVLR